MSIPQRNILFVTRPLTPPWDEASKIFAYNLARLVKTEHVHILTAGTLDDIPMNVTQHNIYTKSSLDSSQKLRSLAFQIWNRKSFPIIHYFFTPAKLNAFLIRNYIKNPSTLSIQTVATLREDLYTDSELKKTLFGDHLITYTESSQKKLESLGFGNVRTIPPGIDLQKYSKRPKDESLLEDLHLSQEDFVIAYPGEYTRLGATDYLADFLMAYFKKYPSSNMKFLFANRIKCPADTTKKQQLERKLNAAGITDKVRFVGTFDNMQKLYNICDVIAFPVGNLHGKFDIPLVIPEAQACEKPVILSDLDAFYQFTQNDNSVMVKRGDVEQLVALVERLRTNPIECRDIGLKARAWALKTFSIENVAQKYETFYASIKTDRAT